MTPLRTERKFDILYFVVRLQNADYTTLGGNYMWFLVIRHRNPKRTIRVKFRNYRQAAYVLSQLDDSDLADIIFISVERI